ncbi:hypothetical protein [Myxococcus eversor]|uniref:hypothetical protein n=1 Tax=Myxococcus eversor TaxID=2709661 RepID=UPI0013CF7CDC|nr:hypothetical protein [Myxococcus eversor]
MKIFTSRHLFKWPLLFSLLFLTPGRALAAIEDAPLEALPGTQPRRALHLMDPAPAAAEPEEVKSEALAALHTSARIAAELGAMSLTALTMGLTGVLVGAVYCDANNNRPSRVPSSGVLGSCTSERVYGFLVGAAVGAPIGVMWGARILGGKGTWTGTLLGAGAGAGAGTVTALLLRDVKPGDAAVPLGALVGSLIGSVVGYELSHSANSARPEPTESRVLPSVAVSQGGMMLGLSGGF